MASIPRKLELVSLIALQAAIVVSVLALGSVHTVWVSVVLALVTVSLALVFVRARQREQTVRFGTFGLAFLVLAGWSAIQAIPLPSWLIGLISPNNAEMFESSWTAAFNVEAPSVWRTISLDPKTTLDRAMRFCALGFAAIATLNMRKRAMIWRVSFITVLSAAAASVLIGLAHKLTGQVEYYGVYKALIKPGMTTFVSANHAASLLGLGTLMACAGAYRGITNNDKRATAASLLAALVLFTPTIELDSAGATILMVLCLGLFGLVVSPRVTRKQLAAAAGAVVAGAVALLAASRTMPEHPAVLWVTHSLESRLHLVGTTLRTSADYWLVGSGAGSVDRVMKPHFDWNLLVGVRVPTIETEWVEWLLTMGWPISILTFVLIGAYALNFRPEPAESDRRRFFRAYSTAVFAYIICIGALHFPFFALGVSLPMVVALEVGIRQLHHLHGDDETVFPFREFNVRLAVLGLVVAFPVLLFVGFAAFDTGDEVPRPLDEDAAKYWVEHTPGESQIYTALAQQALDKDDVESAARLVDYAAKVEPTPRMHTFKAFILAQAGETQRAIEEYKLVADSHMAYRAATDAGTFFPNVADVADALQTYKPYAWQLASREIRKRKGVLAEIEFASRLVELNGGVAESHELLAEAYLAAKQPEVAELVARYMVIERLKNEAGQGPQGYAIWIKALQAQGQKDEAVALTFEAFKAVPGDPKIQRAVIVINDFNVIKANKDAYEDAVELGCSPPVPDAQRMLCLIAESRVAEAEGDLDAAERPLKVITRRHNNPMEQARFYVRNRQCSKLPKLRAELDDEDPKGAVIEGLVKSCIGGGR